MVINKFTLIKIIVLASLLITSSAINLTYTSSFDLLVSGAAQNAQTAIALLTSNQYVICWTAVATLGKQNIYYGVYDTSGNQIKTPQQVDDGSTGVHNYCWMAPDNSGGFAVIWMRRPAATTCSYNIYVFARYFDSTFTGSLVVKVNNVPTAYCVDEYNPNLIYTNTGFIGCYGSVLTKFDNSINILGSKSVENPISKVDDEFCVLTNLKNGTIAVTYATKTSNTESQIYYTIVQENDITQVIFPLTNISSSNVLNTYPSVALVESTPNNKFITTWVNMDTDSHSVWGQYFDLNGNAINSTFQINTALPASMPTVFSLGADGYIVTYNINNVAAFQLYDINGNRDGTEQIVSGISNLMTLNTAFKQNDSLIMVGTYTTSRGFLFQYTSGASGTSSVCSDLTFITSVKDTKPQIAFNGGITNLYITTLTANGTLVDSSNNPLTSNTQIPANNIYYSFTGEPQSDTFNYKINSGDTPCKVTITPCYNSCYYCSTVGNVSDHQCSACRLWDGYFPLIDKITQCYPTTNKPSGYYLNSDVWVTCFSNCEYCVELPVDSTVDMECTVCKTGFYPKEDSLPSNCYPEPVAGYYLDVNIFRKNTGCVSLCKTCNQPSTVSNPNCTSCKANYYPKEDNLTNCYTGMQPQYYFDNINNIYKKCYPTCQTCNNPGVESNHQCDTCITDYFPKSDNLTSCFTGDVPQYYFDARIYQKCFYLCKTCSLSGTPSNNQCSSCINNFYTKEDYANNCYTGDQPQYYLENDIYKKCYYSCKTCNTSGDQVSHQCTSCLNGYYPKADASSTNCYTGSQDYYYLDDQNIYQKCYPTCLSCTTKGTTSDHKCITCVDSYFPKYDNPTSCFTGVQDGYALEGQIYQKCVSNCSSSTNTFNINLANCDPSPCLNDGICSIKLSRVNCQCSAEFVGSLCQYDVNNINIDDLVSNYHKDGSDGSILDLISVLSTHFPTTNNNNLNDLLDNLGIVILILVQSISLTANNTQQFDDKSLDMLNLAMLLQVNLKNNTVKINNLKQLALKLSNLQIKLANLTNNYTLMSGERMFSSLMYSPDNDTLVREDSINNNFAYFNLTNCKEALKDYYNLSNSDIIFITNNFNGSLNEQQVNSYMVSAYNANTKEKLDIDICENITETIEIPLTNLTDFNLTFYKDMKQQGIDILNPDDPYYNDRCMSIVDNDTQADTTINWRRDKYMNRTLPQCVGINCKYHGITDDNYINCTCGIKTDIEMINNSVNFIVSYLTQFNFAIVTCPEAFSVIYILI
jgi:hypothetical protein